MDVHARYLGWATALLLLLMAPGGANARTVEIAGPAALRAAIAEGAGGHTLLLAPGEYGRLDLRPGQAPAVLRSADPARPARFSEAMVRGCRDLRVEGLVFAARFDPEASLNVRPFGFHECTGLTLAGNAFTGSRARGTGTVADGHGTGIGLSVRFSTDVLVERNRFSVFHRGLAVSESRDVVLRGNEVTQVRMDGMVFAQVDGLLIEGNRIHDFDRALDSDDHADMIQIWTASTTEPTRRVTIRNNLLHAGAGAWTQSIFMRNELVDSGRAGAEMFYRDVLIEENLIVNAHIHGITVGETDGLTIRNNTLVQAPGAAAGDPSERTWIPSIRVASGSRDVTVTDNVTGDDRGFRTLGWTVSGNLVVQNHAPTASNHYAKVFADPPADFALRAGMPAAGVTRLRP